MDRETSEIAKLTERIAKDPKSKLFVPLAEEYKKIGDIETAIYVLAEGLKNNPGYATARSFLGRLLMDKGDLAGAQKEFEDVVKAIPDNLLAQRKLGDLYALQDKASDALAHYKAVVALNPKDQETVVLIAELEAGRDIKEKIAKAKPQPVADTEKKPDQPKPAPSPAPPMAAAQPKPTQPLPPQPAGTTAKGPLSRAARPAPEPETAEEVLFVEQLEPEQTVKDLSPEGVDLPAERGPEPLAAGSAEEEVTAGFFTGESQVLSVPQFGEEAAEAVVFPSEEGAEPPAESLKKSDDFTTDTLAELYIAQGFYEKAIDIYDRMLAENPGHQGLQDKLARLRALAAESGGAEAARPEAGPGPALGPFIVPEEDEGMTSFPGAVESEYGTPSQERFAVQPPLSAGRGMGKQAVQAPFAATDREAREYVPPPPKEPGPDPSVEGGFDLGEREPSSSFAEKYEAITEFVPPPAEDFAQASPVTEDVSPAGFAPAKPGEINAPAGQATPETLKDGRKDAISRLEHWLKNITKEK
jgi:tetratricopeptide (TPR) repeat protein